MEIKIDLKCDCGNQDVVVANTDKDINTLDICDNFEIGNGFIGSGMLGSGLFEKEDGIFIIKCNKCNKSINLIG